MIIIFCGWTVNRRTKVTRWQTCSQVFFAVSVVCVASHPSTQDSRTVKVQAWKYWCCKVSDWWEWTMVIMCDKVWQVWHCDIGVTQCVTRWQTSLQVAFSAWSVWRQSPSQVSKGDIALTWWGNVYLSSGWHGSQCLKYERIESTSNHFKFSMCFSFFNEIRDIC